MKRGKKNTFVLINQYLRCDVKFWAVSNGATPEDEMWLNKKTNKKKLPKTAENREKQEKENICPYKSTNILGGSYVKL